MSSTSACCPLCSEMDSIDHIALRWLNPTMNGMHTNRHHVGLGIYVEALIKGRHGSSSIGMDGCRNERLLEQGEVVPEYISRAIPAWLFPNGTASGSSARHQSRPDAVSVRSIPGRFCPDTNPLTTLEGATAQHASTALSVMTAPLKLSSTWDFCGGSCWALGSGEQEKESLGVQKHGGQTFRSPLALDQCTASEQSNHLAEGQYPICKLMRLIVLYPISWTFLRVAGTVDQAEQPNYLAEVQIPL
eukprot:1162060-Pelagomonas_calceolata.AAC.1